jgi:hypothetical protein
MIINDDLRRALLHEAGHAVGYYLLQHQSAGIAAIKEGLKFCNIVAPNSPQMGDAAGSAAEVLFLGEYDKSSTGPDRQTAGVSEEGYEGLVKAAVSLLSPHKRKIRRLNSILLERVRWRESLDDFPPIIGPVGGMQLPQDGNTYSLILPFDEISAAMTTS